MSVQTIYNKLRSVGMTHAGACGFMGNLHAESTMQANIAQRGMTKLTDEQYTAKFDSDPESCYRDGVGYGLAQWTFWTRKKALASFAKSSGVSVGNEDMQIDFAVKELREDYSDLFQFLCSTDDLYKACDRVCREFERPAVNNVDARYRFAQGYEMQFKEATVEKPQYPIDQSILILQAVLVANGYNVELTGYNNPEFLRVLRQFVNDIGG